MSDPVIIEAAINGVTSPRRNPHVPTTPEDLAAVGLRDVRVQRGRHDDLVQERLDRLRHERLQDAGRDREADSRHPGDMNPEAVLTAAGDQLAQKKQIGRAHV